MITVYVTWMDGKQEAYPADRYYVSDGMLVLIEERWLAWDEKRYIPMGNVRTWKAEP